MKKLDRVSQITNLFKKNKKKLKSVLLFLSTNHGFAESHILKYIRSHVSEQVLAKEKIMALFVNAMNAAGSRNLTRSGYSCKKFYSYINKLSDKKTISLNSLFLVFNDSITDVDGLFYFLIENFTNFKHKKAALFLRDLHFLQKKSPKKAQLFFDYSIKQSDLFIPLDIVICTCLNKIFELPKKIWLKSGKNDFYLINEYFKAQLGNSFMLIEDLWFWGYFNFVLDINKNRTVKFNEDKFFSDPYSYPNNEVMKKLKKFNKLIN
jgi:hypothetical protein